MLLAGDALKSCSQTQRNVIRLNGSAEMTDTSGPHSSAKISWMTSKMNFDGRS